MPQPHDWNALVLYKLDDEQARLMCEGPPGAVQEFRGAAPIDPERATLTAAMVDQERSAVGCMVCELTWHEAHAHGCPGEPIGHMPDGEPVYQHPGSDRPVSIEEWRTLSGDRRIHPPV